MNRGQLARSWGNTIFKYVERERGIPIRRHQGKPYFEVIPSPRLFTFSLRLKNSDDLKKLLKINEQLALELHAQHTRIYRDFGNVMIEVPLPQKLCSDLSINDIQQQGGVTVALGRTSLATDVRCRMTSGSVMPMLVAGRTNAGKTEALRLMMYQLANQNEDRLVKFIVFDPKGKFSNIELLPHLAMPVLRTPEQGKSAIQWLLYQLCHRMEHDMLFENVEDVPRLILWVDELIMLMDDSEIGEAIGRIASWGREYGIHMILATQRPDKDHIDRLSSANLGMRLVGQVANAQEAYMCTGISQSGAEYLSGKGDMLAVLDTRIHRIQTALVPLDKFGQLPIVDQAPEMPHTDYNIRAMLSEKSLEEQELDDAPFTPDELAVALTDVGIGKLKNQLGMGQPRATRLRQLWAQPILEKLKDIGYEIKKTK